MARQFPGFRVNHGSRVFNCSGFKDEAARNPASQGQPLAEAIVLFCLNQIGLASSKSRL